MSQQYAKMVNDLFIASLEENAPDVQMPNQARIDIARSHMRDFSFESKYIQEKPIVKSVMANLASNERRKIQKAIHDMQIYVMGRNMAVVLAHDERKVLPIFNGVY